MLIIILLTLIIKQLHTFTMRETSYVSQYRFVTDDSIFIEASYLNFNPST